MTLFGNLGTEGLEETEDRLGGYSVKETDIYKATIKAVYAGKSDAGAQNVTVVLELPDGEFTKTIYITSRAGNNWYHPKDRSTGKEDTTKKVPLPGFSLIDNLCLLVSGKSLSEQGTEEKVVKIYDYEEKKELPKAVQMLTELVGGEVYAGIVKQIVDKNEKNESTGKYEATGETREENDIDKFYHYPSKVTVTEARIAQANGSEAEPVFYGKWLEKNKGQTINKSTASKSGGRSGRPGSPPQSGNSGSTDKPATKSLFNKK